MLEEIAAELGGKVERVRLGLCYSETSVIPWHDAFRLVSLFTKYQEEPLQQILEKLPKKVQLVKELNCPLHKRSQAMLQFALEYSKECQEEAGLVYKDQSGFAYLQPDDYKPLIRLTVESDSMEMASELVEKISQKLR